MSDVILSPNMNLPVPIVGQDPGPDWANNINASLGILDQHNHSNGQGVPVTPAGLNINTDLPLNSNNLTLVNSIRFIDRLTTLPGSAPNLGVIYEAVNELYYNDGVGNVVQLTKAGSVNATSSGISSGTATASFVGGVLVVDANVNTPANVQGASFLFGNNVAASNYATVSPPNALAANYNITLPPTNSSGGTAFLTYDTSNNMGVGPATTHGITRGNLAAYTGQQISASCGNFINDNTELPPFTPVPNLTVTITTAGGPVWIGLQPDGSGVGNDAFLELFRSAGSATTIVGHIEIRNGTTAICDKEYVNTTANFGGVFYDLGFMCLDISSLTPGTYTYTVYMYTDSGNTAFQWNNYVLVAYEL